VHVLLIVGITARSSMARRGWHRRRSRRDAAILQLTADYDYWIAIDAIERFNSLAAAFQLHPTGTAADARHHGRYALNNGEHVDVLVARANV
jgi:hypothetical protein